MKVSYHTTLFSVPKIVRGSFVIIKRCFTKYIYVTNGRYRLTLIFSSLCAHQNMFKIKKIYTLQINILNKNDGYL